MKVELNGTLPSGTASGWVVLAENADEVKGIALDAPSRVTAREIQIVQLPRSEFAFAFYRGNARNSRTFRVASLFTNLADAFDFIELQERRIPHTAQLRLTSTPAGGTIKVRVYSNCQLHQAEAVPGGKTVIIDYHLTFGARIS